MCTSRIQSLLKWCFKYFAEESLRQDEMWLLDGDGDGDGDDSISHKPLCRATRPDHLEFLRITPPDDDIIGETLCCTKHDSAVSGVHTHTRTRTRPLTSKQQGFVTVVSGTSALDHLRLYTHWLVLLSSAV